MAVVSILEKTEFDLISLFVFCHELREFSRIFCWLLLFAFRFAHGVIARSLAELFELRGVYLFVFLATNSANFHEFFVGCFSLFVLALRSEFNPFRVISCEL